MDLQWYIDLRLVHEVHTSERKSFRGCRRRWDWIFRQNYYPKMTPKPLDFGTCFHSGLEAYYDPKTWDLPESARAQLAIRAFKDKSDEQMKKAIAANVMMDSEVEEDFKERVELGVGMLQHFFNYVAPRWDHGWRPKAVEVSFMVPIKHPHTGAEIIWCKCDTCWNKWINSEEYAKDALPEDHLHYDFLRAAWEGLPVVYAGRIDLLAQDERDQFWVVDWKTAARLLDDPFTLYLDDQVGSYPWALWKLGIPVAGFVYHEQKKGFIGKPTRLKVTRLGCSFSTSKSQDTDLDTFVATVAEEDTAAYQAGKYDDYIDWLKESGPKFYNRFLIYKSKEEMEETERNIGLEVLEMINPELAIYPNPGRFSCTTCAFKEPCQEKNSQGDYQYFLDTTMEVREAYYLREELSTDKKTQL